MACGDDASQGVPPTLLWIAGRLPQWQGRTVRAADAYDILADYLEAYACALKARATVLLPGTTQIDWYRQHEQRIAVAREFLHRALLVSAGGGKLQPLVRGFVCLNRASKDLRNVLGLLGEAGACLPVRTWDARGILRTFTDSSSSEP